MESWRLRVLDPIAQQVRDLQVEARDDAAARTAAQTQGLQVLSVEPVRRQKPTSARMQGDIALFCRELRALTLAGLSVVEALEALAERQASRSEGGGLYADLLARLRAGRALSAAMRDLGVFPELLLASVQSSERTSNLPEALDAYLKFDEMVSKLGRKVVSAALYPGIVMGLGLLIAFFLLWVVMPRFAVLYGQMGQDAGAATVLLLEFSQLLHRAPWALPALLLTLIGLAGWMLSAGRWRLVLDRWVDWVAPLARQRRHFEHARVFEALALLVRGGYSFHEALRLCAETAGSAQARARVVVAQQAVEQGHSVSKACAGAGLTDPITLRLLRAGERGGDFAALLHAISLRHAEAFETFVERATRLVEPVLLLGVALLIGGMVVMLYMPIFDIASSVRG